MQTINAPHYILLYTSDDYDSQGMISWYCSGIYESEHSALAALLGLNEATYAHAKIIKVDLPAVALPDDFEIGEGEVIRG